MRSRMTVCVPVLAASWISAALHPTDAMAKGTRSNVRFSSIGEPIEGGSWHQELMAETYFRTDFNRITGIMDPSGPGFELPGFTFEPDSGWTVADYSTSELVVADGPTTSSIEWLADFEGDAHTSPAFGIDFFLTAENEGMSVLVGHGRAFWTGGPDGDWLFSGDTKLPWQHVESLVRNAVAVVAVPLPAAAWLGVLGLGLTGLSTRVQNRRRSPAQS